MDKRAALPWDTSQTIANCTINGNAALAIIDQYRAAITEGRLGN